MGISYKQKYEKEKEMYVELLNENIILKDKLKEEEKINSLLLEKIYKVGGKKNEIT